MIFLVILAWLLGVFAGVVLLWLALPSRLKRHVDYKQRWEDAVALLGTQGRLTEEQVKKITAPQPAVKTLPPPAALTVRIAHQGNPEMRMPPSLETRQALRSMASWDRAELEIDRARRGLPPADDLRGMASWDVKDVLQARAENGTG